LRNCIHAILLQPKTKFPEKKFKINFKYPPETCYLHLALLLQTKNNNMEASISTKTNLQVIEQAFEDFAKGNIPAIIETCSEEIVWGSYKHADLPYSGTFFGKEGVIEFFSVLDQHIHYSYFEPKEFIVQGDSIIVLGHQTGTVKSTGRSFDHDWCFSFKMSNGKVNNYFAFSDTYDQIRAFK
jgi:ketosteroid isomerase-like protein